jgi:hypothetical protein
MICTSSRGGDATSGIVVPPASRTTGASSSPKDSTPKATPLALGGIDVSSSVDRAGA